MESSSHQLLYVVQNHMQLRVIVAHAPKYVVFSAMGATLHHHVWVNSYYRQSGCTDVSVDMNLLACNF